MFGARAEGPYSFHACKGACANDEDPVNSDSELQCSGFNHRQGPSQYLQHCQLYQADQLQHSESFFEADDRYSFYWEYCVKSNKSCSGDYAFTYFSDRYMDNLGVREVIRTNTLEDCLSACLDASSFVCRSASYNRTDGDCFLSQHNQLSKPALIKINNNPNYRIDYYESSCFNIIDTFTFDYECKDDGILVKVASKYPYTGAMYGLYDFFTCRIEPKNDTKFEYFFPSPTISKNCSDSIRYKSTNMVLEIVISTDGVEPLYFITPDDLTYQARCPLKESKNPSSNTDLKATLASEAYGDKQKMVASAHALFLSLANASKNLQSSSFDSYSPRKSIIYKSKKLKEKFGPEHSVTEFTMQPLPLPLSTPSLPHSSLSSLSSSPSSFLSSSISPLFSSPTSTQTMITTTAITTTPTMTAAVTTNKSAHSFMNKSEAKLSNSIEMKDDEDTRITTGNFIIAYSTANYSYGFANSQEEIIPKNTGNFTSSKLAVTEEAGGNILHLEAMTVTPSGFITNSFQDQTTRQEADYAIISQTKAKGSSTPIHEIGTASTKLSVNCTTAPQTHEITDATYLLQYSTYKSYSVMNTGKEDSTYLSKLPTTVKVPPSKSAEISSVTFSSSLSTSSTSVSTSTTLSVTAAPEAMPITTTTTTSYATALEAVTIKKTHSITQTSHSLSTNVLDSKGNNSKESRTTVTVLLKNTTGDTVSSNKSSVQVDTSSRGAKDAVIFDIFHNGQPVEAVVVGSKITLSFIPYYAIPPRYMSIIGCQVEPIGSLFEWEREPLAIIKDGCQADHVGLVCPPQKTEYGIRVTVESFRYQTTSRVQYSCLVRICPFAPCPLTTCGGVDGCTSSTLTSSFGLRSKRHITIEEIRAALAANPDLQRQIQLMNRLGTPGQTSSEMQQQLIELGGDHVVKKQLVVVNSEDELRYYVRTGDVP